MAIAGGDTNTWDGRPGHQHHGAGHSLDRRGPLLRSGARPGDRILVTGSLGGSILGKHLDFEPRVAEALLLAERYELHAGIDVSDGLSLDLSRLAGESGCGARARFVANSGLRCRGATRWSIATDGRSALDHALSDGEDFELVLAVPPAAADQILRDQPLGDSRHRDRPVHCRAWLVGVVGRRRPASAGAAEDTSIDSICISISEPTRLCGIRTGRRSRHRRAWAGRWPNAAPDRAVVGLNGPLGAGKTRLVQAVADASGVDRRTVTSPTFVLVQEYHGTRTIYHADAYRLADADEFWQLGLDERFDEPALVFIEWADRVAELPARPTGSTST